MKKKVGIIIIIVAALITLVFVEKYIIDEKLKTNDQGAEKISSEQNSEDASSAEDTTSAEDVLTAGGKESAEDTNISSLEKEAVGRGDESGWSGELTKYDIRTSPAKITIQIGQTDYIYVIIGDDEEWENYSDSERNEICEENVDSIYFRSTKSSVASVNRRTGKIVGKKKGAAIIKTYVYLANGESAVYKTKVYVTDA